MPNKHLYYQRAPDVKGRVGLNNFAQIQSIWFQIHFRRAMNLWSCKFFTPGCPSFIEVRYS